MNNIRKVFLPLRILIYLLIDAMNNKTKRLLNALLEYVNSDEKYVLKGGLFIGTTIDDVFEKPYQKELNIKLRYIDEEELKAYRNEK